MGIDTSADTVPIASYVPLMMFAILFGLSMDYQVFLLSSINHHRAAGKTTARRLAWACRGARAAGEVSRDHTGAIRANFVRQT